MNTPTQEEINRALITHAEPDERTGRWQFHRSGYWHTTEQAREIVRICLTLGRPVSDIVTTQLFAALLDRLLVLEGEKDIQR